MPAAPHPEGSDTSLAGIFLGVFDELPEAFVLGVPSHSHDYWAPRSHAQWGEILQGIVSNRIRVHDTTRNQRRIRRDENRIPILFGLNHTLRPSDGPRSGRSEEHTSELQSH